MRKENFNSEEDVIRQLEEQECQAVLKQDLAALERLWSEEFIVNNPQNQISTNRSDVLALVKGGLIRYAAFERRIESIRFNADIAIVMGAETVEPVGAAPRAGGTVERRFTHIWRKQEAAWRMIARHANVIAPPPDHSGIGSNESKAPSWDPRSSWERTRIRFRVLQVLSVVAAILVIIWVIQKPMAPAAIRDPREGDLASALIPILAVAIGINLFIEMGFSLFELNDRTLIAYVGRGQRWLKQAEVEVQLARQWQMDVYERYSYELEEVDKITRPIAETEDPKKVVEIALARFKAARDLIDLAEDRINLAENHLDHLIDYPSYQRFKWSVTTYFYILLGLLVATATSMQIFAIMGMQLGNPRMDTVLTGLFIGGLVYPVHEVIANIWDILTKLVKK